MIRFGIYISILIVLSSCGGDKDDDPPRIIVTNPQDGRVLDLPDTIIVRGSVSDENGIDALTISLIDDDLRPTSVTNSVSIGESGGEFDVFFSIEDVEIASGPHFFKLTASDGDNIANEFIEVQVSEVPLDFLGLVIITEGGEGRRYELLETTGEQRLLFETGGGDGHVAIDDIRGKAYVITDGSGDIYQVDLIGEGADVIATIPDTNPADRVVDLLYDRNFRELVVSLSGGRIMRYGENGNLRGSTTLPTQEEGGQLLSVEGDLIVEARSAFGQGSRLLTLDRISFTERASTLVDFHADELILHPSGSIIYIGQQGALHALLTITQNGDVLQRNVEGSGALNDATLSDDDVLLAYGDAFYRFDVSVQQLVPFSTNEVTGVAVDRDAGVAYLSQGSTVTPYDPLFWSAGQSVAFSAPIRDVISLHNK